jgi:hypothetical protein
VWCNPMKKMGIFLCIFLFFGCSTCEERFSAPENEFVCLSDSSGMLRQACTGSQVGYLVCEPEWLCNTPSPITSDCYFCTNVDNIEKWKDNNCENACDVDYEALHGVIPEGKITLTCRY